MTRPSIIHDLLVAHILLTRLPMPKVAFDDTDTTARAAWAYPIVGCVLAVIAGTVGMIALSLGLPAAVAAGLTLAVLIITSGAMHEDGLADSADGLWGGWDVTRRLEIMKDSRIGAYGVIALILTLGLRWVLYAELFQGGQVIIWTLLAATISRTGMTCVMSALPHARENGLSHKIGRPGLAETAGAALIVVGLSLILLSWSAAFWILLCASLTMLVCMKIAYSKIKGQTGDILGASQQLIEITVLAACVVIAA